MYRNVMVPLDGSKLAECVLPHLETLARGRLIANVTLVRVVESARFMGQVEAGFSEKEWQRLYADIKAEAEKYLQQLASRLKYDDVKIKGEIIEGVPVADSLADYATKNNVDLILIATHGRSGVGRWVWGSVAERILHSARVPVLVVRAPGSVSAPSL